MMFLDCTYVQFCILINSGSSWNANVISNFASVHGMSEVNIKHVSVLSTQK